QKNIALFNKYFSRYQHLVCVTVKNNNNKFAEHYETIAILNQSKLRYINVFAAFKIKRIIQNKRASHVLIEHPYLGWMAFLLKHLTRTKLIVHSHNIEAIRFKTIGKWWWKMLWLYEKFIHRQADY